MESASIVIGGAAKVVEIQYNYFTAWCGDIAGCGKSADSIVNWESGNGVINVNVVVSEEIRIERNPEQAALARRIDRETQERCGEQGSVLDYPYLAGLKANKEPSIGRKFHCRGCT